MLYRDKRVPFLLLSVCVCVLLGSCGYAGPAYTYNGGQQTVIVATAPAIKIEPCSLVSKTEAQQIFGEPDMTIEAAHGVIFVSCTYGFKDKMVAIQASLVLITKDAEKTWYEMEKVAGGGFKKVDGIGEKARYRQASETQLDVLRKNLLMTITVSIINSGQDDSRKAMYDAAMKMALFAALRL